MNMPQPHTKNRPARWPSPVSGTIGSRDGWKDLIRMTQEPAMQQAIDKLKTLRIYAYVACRSKARRSNSSTIELQRCARARCKNRCKWQPLLMTARSSAST